MTAAMGEAEIVQRLSDHARVNILDFVSYKPALGLEGQPLVTKTGHPVCRPFVDSQFIATLEFNGYSFQDGLFTDPVTGAAVRSSGGNYFGVGPGFRWVISQHCDFGFGVNFSVTRQHLADQLYRSELRLRF